MAARLVDKLVVMLDGLSAAHWVMWALTLVDCWVMIMVDWSVDHLVMSVVVLVDP